MGYKYNPFTGQLDVIGSSATGSGGGTTDHGALTGLADDDHSQYHTDARGDARYYTQSQIDTSMAGKSNTGHDHNSLYYTETEVDNLLGSKSDTTHNHDVDYADISHNHDASYSAISHTHTAANITDFDIEVSNNASVIANTAKISCTTANVDSAGATMNTDTNVSGNSWVLDEDTMSSDSSTKVPTQQSVKAYVDANAGGAKQWSYVVSNDSTGDYNCDGTADDVEIQQAIDQANTDGGGVVFIKEGTYTITNEIVVKTNVILQGAGWGTIITVGTTNLDELINFSGSYAVVRELSVDGNAETNTNGLNGITVNGSQNKVENCFVHDIGKNGILTYTGSYNTIFNCEVARCARRAVGDNILVYNHDNKVIGCTAYDNYDASGNCFGVYSNADANYENTISDCIAYLTGTWGSTLINGFNLEGCKKLVLSNCMAHDCQNGIYVSDPGASNPTEIVINNCILNSNNTHGINIDEGAEISISNCQMNDNTDRGLNLGGGGTITDLQVTNCLIANNGSYGVQSFNTTNSEQWLFNNCIIKNNSSRGIDPGTADYVTISNCIIEGNSMGIECGGTYNTVSNCIIKDNSQQGLNFDAGGNHKAIGNTVVNNGQHGIEIDCNYVIVSGNYIDGNSDDVANYDGIRILSSKNHIVINDNIITDTQGTKTQEYAIQISSGGDYIMVTNNDLSGNLVGGISGSVGANGVNTNNMT